MSEEVQRFIHCILQSKEPFLETRPPTWRARWPRRERHATVLWVSLQWYWKPVSSRILLPVAFHYTSLYFKFEDTVVCLEHFESAGGHRFFIVAQSSRVVFWTVLPCPDLLSRPMPPPDTHKHTTWRHRRFCNISSSSALNATNHFRRVCAGPFVERCSSAEFSWLFLKWLWLLLIFYGDSAWTLQFNSYNCKCAVHEKVKLQYTFNFKVIMIIYRYINFSLFVYKRI